MENQNIVALICKTILYIISILVWAVIFITLILLTAPILALLQLVGTIVIVKIFWGKSKRDKEMFEKLSDLDERIKKLESEKIVDNIISKTENREGR
jgi:ABC-type bacteriocin/lantibiotic exporter with double-glycine peptidase domain